MNFNKILIADDEPAARRKIRAMLAKLIDQKKLQVDEIREANDGLEAEKTIITWQPNLVFLDINMPYKNGLQVAAATQGEPYHLIFITAYDEHAISAFETHALDYLLKPVAMARLMKALEKISLLQQQFSPQVFTQLEQDIQQKQCQISIKRGSATVVINSEDIGYLEALSGYCRIHLTKQGEKRHKLDTLLSDAALGHIQQQLPQDEFIRIHRSYVVNCMQVQNYYTKSRRVFIGLIDFKQDIPVSRSNAKMVRERWPGQ